MKALATGFLLSLSLCLDLGIVNLAILRTALRQGGWAGFLIGLGSSVGDLAYFSLAVLGAAALLEWAPLRWGLWVLGTCVLLYLAGRMVREVIHPKQLDIEHGAPISGATSRALLVAGLALALVSPTSILWFAAVGGSVIASLGGNHSVWRLAAGFLIGGVAWSAFLAYAAAGMGGLGGKRFVRVLSLISALLFLYFAAVVFLNGLRYL